MTRYDLPDEILVDDDGPVRIVTLNRPTVYNAANAGLHTGLTRVWNQISADPDARAIVITGAGSAFSAGGDIRWFEKIQQDAELRHAVMREARDLVYEMIRCPLPIVAAVNGPAVGLGCSVAVLCDSVLMAEGAYLADPHVAMGLVAGDGGALIWPVLMGPLRAKEFLFTGDRISAADAVRLGLANRVVSGQDVADAAKEYAHRLARLPARALQDTKRAVNLHLEQALATVLNFALAAESECFTREEHREQVARFLERSA